MLCSNAQNLILEVVTDEAEVPAAEREAFFAHVGWCSGCREEYEQEQAIRLALQTYGELSSDTVEILESRGQVVGGGHLSSDVNEPHGLDEAVQAMDVEVGLARLMEAVDAREAQCGEEEGGFEGSRSLRGLEDSVADLRRRVNTLEAYQEPVREVWRSQASGVGGARAMDTLSTSWRNVPVWPVAACLSAAACLVFSLVVGWLYAPSGGSSASQARGLGDAGSATLEQITAVGLQPLVFGKPIVAADQLTELLLGGRHRVVLNRGTTVTVEADPLAQATAAGEHLAWRVDLAGGEMYAEVVPGSDFAVTTPNALATITGTKFNLLAQAGASELTLVKGSVSFASRYQPDGGVDVLAGYGSVVKERGVASPPVVARVSGVVAWAQSGRGFVGPSVVVGAGLPVLASEQIVRLGDLGDEVLKPRTPDYRTWSYERFLDEMRPWFAEQFPWAMVLEEALVEDYGIEADYLDVLVVSGDIWQFRYSFGSAARIPVFDPAALERLAAWYGLDYRTLRRDVGDGVVGKSRSHESSRGRGFADAIKRWYLKAASSEQPNYVRYSERAGDYLHLLRSATFLWLREHPEVMDRLLASQGDYVGEFLIPLALGDDSEDQLLISNQLDIQIEALRRRQRFCREWLLTDMQGRICPLESDRLQSTDGPVLDVLWRRGGGIEVIAAD